MRGGSRVQGLAGVGFRGHRNLSREHENASVRNLTEASPG